ncbi:PAS domain-containing protein [bacterium]|nr:PAS domain-containing protein [bacterium]
MTSPDFQNNPASPKPAGSLRSTHYLIFGGLIVLLLVQLVFSLRRHKFERELTITQENRELCLKIADELRRNWDELGNMARLFVATGNPAYEHFFNEILAIRDGQSPRPAEYDKVYWDMVLALGHQPSATRAAISVDSRIKKADFTKAEIAKVEESNRQAANFLLLTRVAMNAAKGIYRDARGHFGLSGAPNREYAARMLAGPEFVQAKARVLKPILDLQTMLDRRTRAEFQRVQTASIYNARLETGWIALIILAVLGGYTLLNRRIFEPIAQLAASAAAVGRNGFFRRVLVTSQDELGTLASAMNRMSETVEEKIAEADAADKWSRQVLDSTADAIVISDAESTITEVNRSAEALLGYAREELIGQPLTLIIPPLVADTPEQQPELASDSLPPVVSAEPKQTARRKDGSEFPAEISVSPLTGADGSQLVCSTIRDGSEVRVHEQQVDALAVRQSNILDTLPQPVLILDSQARITACNRAFEQALGVSRNSVLGRTTAELESLSEPVRELLRREETEALRIGSRREFEIAVSFSDETQHRLRGHIECLPGEGGTAGGLIEIFMDVTAESNAADAIAETRSVLQTLIDQASSPIYVKDTEGRYRFTNASYDALLGRSPGSLIGLSAVEAFGRKLGKNSDEADRDVRVTRELRTRDEILEIEGQARSFQSKIFPVVNDRGDLFGTAGIAEETTELRATQAELAAAQETLEQLSEQLAKRPEAVSESQSEFAGKHVLLAVSDGDASNAMKDALRSAGLKVDLAETGDEALKKIGEFLYDAVLLDLELAGLGGLETTGIIRQQMGEGTLPLIGITAKATNEQLAACKKAGMNDYVTLPPNGNLLLRVMRKWLNAERMEAVSAPAESLANDDPELTADIEDPDTAQASTEMAPADEANESEIAEESPITDEPSDDSMDATIVEEVVVALPTESMAPEQDVPPAEPLVSPEGPTAKNAASDEDKPGAESAIEELSPTLPEVTDVPPTPEESSAPDSSEAAAPPDEAKPARKKKSSRKKKAKQDSQPDLFGGYAGESDDTGPETVAIEPDGIPSIPGFDLRDAVNRLSLSPDAIKQLVIEFAGTLERMFGDLQSALSANDHEAARELAHSLAGAAGHISADNLRRLAKTLELGLKFEQGDLDKITSDLHLEAARLMNGIRQLETLDAGEPAPMPTVKRPPSPTSRKLQTVLEELAAALEDGEIDPIRQAVDRLKSQSLPEELQAHYERLSECVDSLDYTEAAEVVRSMQALATNG